MQFFRGHKSTWLPLLSACHLVGFDSFKICYVLTLCICSFLLQDIGFLLRLTDIISSSGFFFSDCRCFTSRKLYILYGEVLKFLASISSSSCISIVQTSFFSFERDNDRRINCPKPYHYITKRSVFTRTICCYWTLSGSCWALVKNDLPLF